MKTPTNHKLTAQIENLVSYLCANQSENLTIFCGDILSWHGDTIARFNNHLQAVTAVKTIRKQIALKK